jgi:hypothetical protein
MPEVWRFVVAKVMSEVWQFVVAKARACSKDIVYDILWWAE